MPSRHRIPLERDGKDIPFGPRLVFPEVEDGVALPQPRLVVDGDVKGGRYVSGGEA